MKDRWLELRQNFLAQLLFDAGWSYGAADSVWEWLGGYNSLRLKKGLILHFGGKGAQCFRIDALANSSYCQLCLGHGKWRLLTHCLMFLSSECLRIILNLIAKSFHKWRSKPVIYSFVITGFHLQRSFRALVTFVRSHRKIKLKLLNFITAFLFMWVICVTT